MFKIITSFILLTGLILGDTPILQTGQLQSYDADGNMVTDNSIKDDGYYKAGQERSYSRNGDIVTDDTTGLQWQDDTLSPYMVTSETQAYCTGLSLGEHEDWRVPKIGELLTLIDSSQFNPSVPQGLFNTNSFGYWSSTVSDNLTGWAWTARIVYGGSSLNSGSSYVRCARGDSLTFSNFIRDDVSEIVTDTTNGLQWQDNSEAETIKGNWTYAIDYCENTLTLGGYTDWRLPNRNELASIVDYTQFNPSISVFTHIVLLSESSPSYWTSTSSADRKEKAWLVDFYYGQIHYDDEGNEDKKSDHYYVRCVRNGQLGPLTCPEGQHKKQGERVCIPGTPTADPGTYLPNCGSDRLIQGTEECNDTTVPVDPPGLFLSCPSGEIRIPQGGSCVVNPFCTDADKDTYFAEEGCGTSVDCNDGDSSVNPGMSEGCNGVDDNCDGKVDEPENLTPPLCPLQQGVCSGSVMQCGGNAGWLSCDYLDIPSFHSPEVICDDALDNDCDGQVDCPI